MQEQQIIINVSKELSLKESQVKQTINLLDDGNTVPFLARYRKENTGGLDEEQIRDVLERVEYLRNLEKRKEAILKSIDEQGKLTPELKSRIESTHKLQELEDLYLPYKPKKKTRATIAKEKGLEPLANLILLQETLTGNPLDFAKKYVSPEKEVNTPEEAIQGALDIIAENISENADIRKTIREKTSNYGLITSKAKSEEETVYEMYNDYSEPVKKIPSHRILAINRGEKEGKLKVKIEVDVDKMLNFLHNYYIRNYNSIFSEILQNGIDDSYKRLIAPSIEREIRKNLSAQAEEKAIKVFATNLKNLLLQPPLKNTTIMGIDPGFISGCKIAVIDKTGKYLEGTTIYPHPPQKRADQAKSIIRKMAIKYNVRAIAIGNGTASRETEKLIVELIKDMQDTHKLSYIIVNEAGASVYSASRIAKQEFPDLEASMRGNISIARRLLDPLAELVKIEPKSIGVGQYQHDVNQKQLNESLHNVIEDCVNKVGVNINTASSSLLSAVSGLTSRTAENIVKYREKNGIFKNRKEINKVAGIGLSSFEQAAGFLRIPDGDNPLDNTSIHPESYDATSSLLNMFSINDVNLGGKMLRQKLILEKISTRELSKKLNIGEPTLIDILADLEKPGRDPRDELPKPILKNDVLSMKDLKEGMVLKGTVRNVVDFGAFVDIGVKHDGLVHISQIANRYIKDPNEIVAVGDIVDVKILSVDTAKERIGLSMKNLS